SSTSLFPKEVRISEDWAISRKPTANLADNAQLSNEGPGRPFKSRLDFIMWQAVWDMMNRKDHLKVGDLTPTHGRVNIGVARRGIVAPARLLDWKMQVNTTVCWKPLRALGPKTFGGRRNNSRDWAISRKPLPRRDPQRLYVVD
ncbi:6249_t:CDS:2, partial [Funneliformis geosporum]